MRRAPTIAVILSCLAATAASADNCARSRDYLLGGLAGELPQGPQAYKQLFNTCLATAELANIKDAYILKDGGIGAVAKNESIAATASTLSNFCQRFPRATLRFITQKELSRAATIARTIAISSGGITSCRQIRGLAS
jgi:hypothetical protein